jgi:uncharacterized repeat protein (TIGR01451 family)
MYLPGKQSGRTFDPNKINSLMKKIILLAGMLLMLLIAQNSSAQVLVCNDLVSVSLGPECMYTLTPDNILEGTQPDNCVVELDRTPPYGNGPWTGPDLGVTDIGKVYMVRVRHVPSGVTCWGNLEIVDKLKPELECGGLSTVDLNGGGPVNVPTNTLSIVANDACSNVTLTPASLDFDCPDLGVQTVQLSATDAYNNTQTCLHSILVTNGGNCNTCVDECPPSLTLNYDEGNNNLLAAFLNNDWSAFDTYGNALFNVACNYVDSTYTIDYQPGTAGQSWFTRQWQWTDAGGATVTCEQAIVFPRTHRVTVQGKVYIDSDEDCFADAGEQPVYQYPILLTKLPSGETFAIYPATDGSYTAVIDFNAQDASVQLNLIVPPFVNPVCATALNIPNLTGNPSVNFDMGIQSEGECPRMRVDLSSLFMRRCGSNFFWVNYCNDGLDTAYNAVVTVDLDPLIDLTAADFPHTVSGPNDLITFAVGDVPPFFCGSIKITAMISCDAMPGQTLCNEATVTPSAPCDGAWQGAEIETSAQCDGDSVQLILTNKGPADMNTTLNYIVVEDFIMYREGDFQLATNESMTITVPANGATWRLEAEQENGYPNANTTVAAIEGCGGINVQGVITALGANDNGIGYDQYCGIVVASCDPNDKTAVPVGVGPDQLIRPNEWIEYKIRFQNTGTDTAFRVVVVDTLSPLFNTGSIELGAASHPYRLDIFPGGILNFVFDPIALPDSNVNEPASHGFLQFRIAQQPDLPDGTRLENTVAIYFDQNEPVFTNTAFHTIGDPITVLDPLAIAAESSSPSCHGATDGALIVRPSGGLPPYTLEWNNPAWQGDTLNNIPAGEYRLTLTDSRGMTEVATFVLTQPDALQMALESTPTLGNDHNGTALAVPVGGTAPYAFLWSNGANTPGIENLPAGTYSVVITDAHGCTQTGEVQVQQTVLPLSANSQTLNPACHGSADGAIAVFVDGGLAPYTFTWSEAGVEGNSPSGLPAGTYHLNIGDSFGGEINLVFTLTEPDALQMTLESTPTLGNDHNGTALAVPVGGTAPYAFLWSNGANTPGIENLPAGTYSVVITDAHGCTQTGEVQVQQTVLPLSANSQTLNPACHGSADGAIAVFVDGGLAPYTFTWSEAGVEGDSPSGLPAGIYHLNIADSFGGEINLVFTLTEPAALETTLSASPTQAGAATGTATAQTSGGTAPYTYLWSNGATTAFIEALPAGVYTVVVTDAQGCTQTGSINVEESVSAFEPGLSSLIRAWPNPAHDQVRVDLKSVGSNWSKLELLSADGRLLQRFNGGYEAPNLQISLEPGLAGSYVVIVLHPQNGKVWIGKVMVQ